MLNIILGICGITMLAIGAVVFYSDSRSPSNRWLGAVSISGSLWVFTNLLANTSSTASMGLLFSRFTLVGSALIAPTFLMFCYNFTGNQSSLSLRKYLVIFTPVVAVLATVPTRLNVVSAGSHGSDFKPGFSYIALLLMFIIYFTIGTVFLFKDYRRASSIRRQQLYYILLGTALSLIPGLLIDVVLPLIGRSSLVDYGPTVLIFFVTFTTYAIIKHRLFDVRLLIARSIGYLVTLIVMASIYGFFVFGAAQYIFHFHFSASMQILLSIATSFVGLTFERFKKVFNKSTNRIFYRDAYDTQDLFGSLNKTLVSSLNLDYLLKHVAEILAESLKSSSVMFVLKRSEGADYRITGTVKSNYDMQYIAKVHSLITSLHQTVLVTDLMSEKQADLKLVMKNNDIAVLVQLLPDLHKTNRGLGHIILGPKKSGNPYTSQDIRVLSAVADELIIAIQNALHFEEIQRFNLTLQDKVNEATRKMRRTNEKLKALDETKDDFISMASHQLRTPLTSVKGYISMVLEEDAGKITPMQREMLGQAFFSSQRMVYLISDLLNVSRLKTGKFIIEATKVDLVELVHEEMRQLEESAASRSLTLTFEAPKDFPTLMFDETKTRQIIMNFVDNAIYYTPAGGHVVVRLVNNLSTVELRVEDDGIGVPKAEQPHLFTKFYRAANARQARPDGTGLGLFMAKKVIAAQGGSTLFSSVEGKGSMFGFVFSKAKLALPETDVAPPASMQPAAKQLTKV